VGKLILFFREDGLCQWLTDICPCFSFLISYSLPRCLTLLRSTFNLHPILNTQHLIRPSIILSFRHRHHRPLPLARHPFVTTTTLGIGKEAFRHCHHRHRPRPVHHLANPIRLGQPGTITKKSQPRPLSPLSIVSASLGLNHTLHSHIS